MEAVIGEMIGETTEGTIEEMTDDAKAKEDMEMTAPVETTEVGETEEMIVTIGGEMAVMETIVQVVGVGMEMTALVVEDMEGEMIGEKNMEIGVMEMIAQAVVVAVDMATTDPVEAAITTIVQVVAATAMTVLAVVAMVEMTTVLAGAMEVVTQMTAAMTTTSATMMIPAATTEAMEEVMVISNLLALLTAKAVMADPMTSRAHSNMPNQTPVTPVTPTYSALPLGSLLARNPRLKRRMLTRMMQSSSTKSSMAMEATKNNPIRIMSVLPLRCKH